MVSLAAAPVFVLPFRRVDPGFMTSDAPGLLDALGDVEAMRLWELIRVQRSPISLSELAALSGMPAGNVQPKLELLANAGLARTVRARKPRNSVGYVATHERMVVAFDPSDPATLERIRQIAKAWERDVAELIDGAGDQDADPRRTFRSRYVGVDHLEDSDFAELKRRIDSVCEFWNMLACRNGSADGSTRRVRRGNHAISIKVEPLNRPVLPIPEVWFRPREAAERDAARRARTVPRSLTAREAEVARALAGGLHRKQVATQLGISIHTVTTMCKRIYAKLGVRSQAELAARLQGYSPPQHLRAT